MTSMFVPASWIQVLSEFGKTIYEGTEVQIFATRGFHVINNPRYKILKTDAVLYEILNWVGESNAQVRVAALRAHLESARLISADGELIRT